MSLRDLLAFVFKWKVTIAAVIVLVTGLVTFFVYVFPPGYGAKASLLVERTSSAGQYSYAANQDMVEILNTEAAIVTSRPVIEAVVDELGLGAGTPQPRTGLAAALGRLRDGFVAIGLTTDAAPRERWIERLQRQVKAKPGTQSSVLTIAYNNVDPARAQAVTNAVSRHYVQRHREIFSEPGLSDFYLARMVEIEQELGSLRAELVAVGGAEIPRNVRTADAAEIARLRGDLSEKRTELSELQAQFLPGYRLVRVVREQIQSLEAAIEEAEADALIDLNASPEARQLALRIANQESALTDIKTRYEEAVLSERSQSNFLDVRIISEAAQPAKPNISRLLLIFIAFFSSVVLAAMFAVISEYFDDRMGDPRSVEGELGLPCHGVLNRA
jgi:uncharacterized protein involved in exopolysaccharide biosynthesis